MVKKKKILKVCNALGFWETNDDSHISNTRIEVYRVLTNRS